MSENRQTTRVNTKQAHENANAFAGARSKEFLKAFLADTGILATMYEVYTRQAQTERIRTIEEFQELLCDDYELSMGKILALTYGLAYVDGTQGKKVRELHLAPLNIQTIKPQILDKDGKPTA